jgi:hypothetical protein
MTLQRCAVIFPALERDIFAQIRIDLAILLIVFDVRFDAIVSLRRQ